MALSSNLSARQIDLLKAYIEVTHSKVKWEEVASCASFSTAKYARDSWLGLKKKLLSGDSKVNISERQYKLLKAYIAVMSGSTDWAAVAQKSNFSSPKYARDSWLGVKTKLGVDTTQRKADVTGDDGADAAAVGGDKNGKATAKSRAGGKKRKMSTAEDAAGAGEETMENPSSKKKAKVDDDESNQVAKSETEAQQGEAPVEDGEGSGSAPKPKEDGVEGESTASGAQTYDFDFPDWK